MPKSAINTSLTDFILTPKDIADEIQNYCSYPTAAQLDEDTELFKSDELLSRIYAILKKQCGIDYTHYKRATVTRRIERRCYDAQKQSSRLYAHPRNPTRIWRKHWVARSSSA